MVTYVSCICTQCGVKFSRELGEYNHNKGLIKNPKGDFCSPKCFLSFVKRNNIVVSAKVAVNKRDYKDSI